MSQLGTLLIELAELQEAAAARLRAHATRLNAAEGSRNADKDEDVVSRARQLHPSLGPRQEEILRLVAAAGPDGTDTGSLSRAMEYDQPNVYLTLQALIRHKLVRRDTRTNPHRYYLASELG